LEIVRIEKQLTAIRRNDSTLCTITSTGALTVLHSFGGTDGSSPNMLLLSTEGNSYGAASLSGANGDGTVFGLTSNGAVNTLHNFGSADGALPLVTNSGGIEVQLADGIVDDSSRYRTLSEGEAREQTQSSGPVAYRFIHGRLNDNTCGELPVRRADRAPLP
jgi:hypothetical protein